MSEITLFAPAKINLTLEVLGRRDDGYHETRSVMQALSLTDRLDFEHGERLAFECDLPVWQAERSLVWRAADMLRAESGCPKGATVRIAKRIPLTSGLGGDASDAAAVLTGLNALWQTAVSLGRLAELAAQLGSDVPFFLRGGTALARGRGEVFSSLPALTGFWLAVVTADVPRPPAKTAALYACLGASDYTSGEHTETLASHLERGGGIAQTMLYNVFERVADDAFPGLERVRQDMLAAGAGRVHLAGAGPSLFSLHSSRAEAEEICRRLIAYPAVVAETLGTGVQSSNL